MLQGLSSTALIKLGLHKSTNSTIFNRSVQAVCLIWSTAWGVSFFIVKLTNKEGGWKLHTKNLSAHSVQGSQTFLIERKLLKTTPYGSVQTEFYQSYWWHPWAGNEIMSQVMWLSTVADNHRFSYAPNIFTNAFVMLSFASKLALSSNPLLYLII